MVIDAPATNWHNLTRSLDWYTQHGFTYLEVPWVVPSHITKITFDGTTENSIKSGDLVGSSEQSFLYLHALGKLPPGKYCALTPCFRTEPVINETHRPYFMKLELIITDDVTDDNLKKMIVLCAECFGELSGQYPSFVPTPYGYDIELNGIEVGSYGIRTHNDFSWIYGTGIAEPRFSVACNHTTSHDSTF